MSHSYQIVFASNNNHKLNEVIEISKDFPLTIIGQGQYKIESPIENGATFIENALIKANHTFSKIKKPVIADDSGICVEALNGNPGIYSARYASDNATDSENRYKLTEELDKTQSVNRKAKFACAAVFIYPNSDEPIIVYEEWEGLIINEDGVNGFGYDPLFYDASLSLRASEMSNKQKNMVSHRGKAFKKLFLAIANQLRC
jgi:XTP/dITP diphosphohydrolase